MAKEYVIDGDGKLVRGEVSEEARPSEICLYLGGRLYPVGNRLTDSLELERSDIGASAKAARLLREGQLALEAGLEAKAEKTEVAALEEALSGKAAAETVAELAAAVSGKADSAMVAAMQTTLASKADAATVAALGTALETKADRSELEARPSQEQVAEAIAGASATLANMVADELDRKADKTALETKADKETVDALVGSAVSQEALTQALAGKASKAELAAYATMDWSISEHPIKISGSKTFYVGGENVSDTADLFNGRGESPEMPFATLQAAMKFAAANYMGNEAVINVMADVDAGDFSGGFMCCNFRRFIVQSGGSEKRTIRLTGNLTCKSGCLWFRNLKITSGGAGQLSVSGMESSHVALAFENCDISLDGSQYVCVAFWGGSIFFHGSNSISGQNNSVGLIGAAYNGKLYFCSSGPTTFNGGNNASGVFHLDTDCSLMFLAKSHNLAGEFSGKRYSAYRGSKIISGARGPNFIPGTEAGSCDESSVYV